MSKIQDRYKIVPQMESYDSINCEFKPFVMFFNSKNHKSKVVNTDKLGFRYNLINHDLISFSDLNFDEEYSIVLGGSTVFGFGSSNDNNTISSNLNKLTGEKFINFGGTAFCSKQELYLFLNFFQKFKKIKRVIIISGANDVYLNLLNSTNHEEWGDFFFKEKYFRIFKKFQNRGNYLKKILHDIKKKILNSKEIKNEILNNINTKKLNQDFNEIFNLWSNLSRSFNFELFYFLQPIPTWMDKDLSLQEIELFKILDQTSDASHNLLKIIGKKNNYINYLNLLKDLTNKYKIKFIDLNQCLDKSNKWLFVDRVHLNDTGYELIAKNVLKKIN